MSFWKNLFGKKEEKPSLDPLADLVLEKLKPGYLLDYDLRTWQVVAQHYHDMGDGYRREEWELRSDEEIYFLNREEDEGVYWHLTRQVPVDAVDRNLRNYIREHNDPPETLDYEGVHFRMCSYGGAKFYRNGEGPPQPFLYWDYEDEKREKILTIEQWGDIEFEAYFGQYVEEYQFTNILPGKLSS